MQQCSKRESNGFTYFLLGLSKNVVVTQFYGSDFFGKSAKDILHGFEAWLGPLPTEKMIQISSDGSNVNLPFLDMIKDNRLTKKLQKFN